MTFQRRLEKGQAVESAISKWLQSRGCNVFPAYEKIIDNGKGRSFSLRTEILSCLICWFLALASYRFSGPRLRTNPASRGTAHRAHGKPESIYATTWTIAKSRRKPAFQCG